MNHLLFDKIEESKNYIIAHLEFTPTHALVLGTGLDISSTRFTQQLEIPFRNIPYFPMPAVSSHKGKLWFGSWYDQPVIVLSGRSHYYEGYSAADVAFPVQVLASLGCRHVIFTNAAGGVNPHFNEGDIIQVEDHINLIPDNPLRGFHDERLGLRFPDMMHTYCQDTIDCFYQFGLTNNIDLKTGVYLALPGPSLETPAEYNMAYRMGADMVGMSTVPEVIAARHAGMKVNAFSIISNVCYPKSRLTPTTVEEVIQTVQKSNGQINTLLDTYFQSL